MTLTPEREAELRIVAQTAPGVQARRRYSDLLSALDEARRELQHAMNALSHLAAWQPHTLHVLDRLHPQHKQAVLRARELTGGGE